MLRSTVTLLWRLLAVLALVAGAIGVFVPVLPTVPFILVAAWAGSRGWPALERWLLDHARFGPAIRDWRHRGAVPRRAKWYATLAMTGSGLMIWWFPLPLWVQAGVCVVMACVACWLWWRPE
ncbi:YbaN family protein [Caldimonas thermodepolymerans]|jgi:Uncharacterized protein conserved in bacteria|uniref:DUF454 domain-containing protein n=1 Tax=Caldimonas thermodepolymerans TaxID=215580 RepID=A0A2S5T6S7_9BURK|nr:YbaN family protein [Caldimonas thermodepolymerans]PPE70681.1 DUF454 domain-containing protein [Caldimonas thermodepolymerans]QPC33230.1 YbaN family protein [Caldimonas thermodepolymerans]RDH97553.1 hypothetical protein DES46_10866 [Caldimonas thermodepolymerans]TCP09965.1 hypothetical protein EV676_101549 [Caldimonas thermodepolymerans]UZG42670.1 YbaN family protein [Caldimonas thermodepolymerans]